MYNERPSCFSIPLPGRNQPSHLLYVILEIFYALLFSLWSEICPDLLYFSNTRLPIIIVIVQKYLFL